ncbi:MAG: alpha-mannosidase [Clostridia bacterium]|nr:alpha-mannosidase [Clostridia bacterium]
MFLTIEKLEARTRELENFRFARLSSIAPMTAMEGGLGTDEVYHGMPEKIEGGQIAIGDEFVGRDRYLWVQKTVELPAHMDGMEVYGLFDFGKTGGGHNSGFESLLYVDGHPYQGVDTFHNDVNFESLAGKTVTLTFMLWTGLEGGGPKRTFRHLIRQADIGYLHKAADEFYYLAKAIFKTVKLLDDTSTDRFDLTRALDRAFHVIDWDPDCFYETVDEALSILKTELAALEKHSNITVNVVGHTHIDVAWLWRLKHTREKAQRSFATVLRLMEEFDEYIFLQSQPQLYQYIKNDCPEIYEKIRERVGEGRWEADGGMWLEADCNVSSGEALTRQFLQGTGLIKNEFGRKCEYLWLPDVFGYSWALPQILKGCGIDTFMTTKISWNQFNSIPHDLFKWRGIDGSEVMTYFITTPEVGRSFDERFSTYNGMVSPRAVLGSWKKFKDKALSNETLLSYGYGDGGGGVNRNMLKMRRAMEDLPGLPNVKPSRVGDFFRRLHEKLDRTDRYIPVWDGELYLEYHRGTYTSQAWNKMMNRRMEFALAECEWLSQMASRKGVPYDKETLDACWQTILRNQIHDIIPGSSITEVYEDCHREYGAAADALRNLAGNALSALTRPEEDAWTLWHFGSFDRKDPVFIEETREGSFIGADGKAIAAQKTDNGYWVSVSLPALSMATVRFVPGKTAEAAAPFCIDLDKRVITTPFYRIGWNENGSLTDIYDIENRRQVLPEGACANVLEVFEDKPLAHENWDVDIYHLFKSETAKLSKAPVIVENGALRAVIRFEYAYRQSAFVQDMILYADSRRIDFKTEAEWHESRRLLKAAFPADVRATRATYDIQYGHVERPTHFNTSWDYARFEVVAHKWADLSDNGYGVSILNNCKYGHSVHGNVMRITLLKAGKYPDTQADMGHHAFTYALLPHTGSVANGNTIEESVNLNLPVRVVKNACADSFSMFTKDANIVIDAVKQAEDGDGLIVRFHECRGARCETELVPGFKALSFTPSNLLEEPVGETVSEETLRTTLRPFEIQTWRVKLG